MLILFLHFLTHATLGIENTKKLHHPESAYKKAWCTQNKGIQEYINFDKTRVDCLTSNHAVELDFAPKWAQSVGQALHYQHATGKKAKVVLIIENPQKDLIYLTRVQSLAKTYNFEVECVFPDILSK